MKNNTVNSAEAIVAVKASPGQYDGIAIPIDIVQELASIRLELASMQRKLDIALECPVCFNHRKDTRLQCGHLFCQAYLEQVQVTTCPICRQPVGTSPPRRVFP